jgi:Leucine-rich repeat (LRR) protein
MGASASCLPEQLDESTARALCGSQWFEQENFDKLKAPDTCAIPRARLEKLGSGQRHSTPAILWSTLEYGWSHQIEVPFPEVPPPVTAPTGPVVLIDAVWLIKMARKNEAVLKAYGSRSRPSSPVQRKLTTLHEDPEGKHEELTRLKARLANVDRYVVPCRQELPMEAIIDPADVDRENTDIFCINCPWFTPQHPDPVGFHLRQIAPVLELFMRLEKRRAVVYWDWVSLFQPTYFSPTSHPPNEFPEMTDEELDGVLDEWDEDEPGSPVATSSMGSPGSPDSQGSVSTGRKGGGWTRCTEEEGAVIEEGLASVGDWFANRGSFVLVQDEPPEKPGHEARLEIDLVVLEDHPPTVEEGGDEFSAYMQQHFGIRLVDSSGAFRRLTKAEDQQQQGGSSHQDLQSMGTADDISEDGQRSIVKVESPAVVEEPQELESPVIEEVSPERNIRARQVWGDEEEQNFADGQDGGSVSLESSAAHTSKYLGVGFGSVVVEDVGEGSLGAAAHIKAGYGIIAVEVISSNLRYVVSTLDGLEMLLKKLRASVVTCDLIFERVRDCERGAWTYFQRAVAEFSTPDERLLSISVMQERVRHWNCHHLFHRSKVIDDDEHAFIELYKYNGGKRDPISWSDFMYMHRSFGAGNVIDLRSPRVNPPLRPDLFEALLASKEFYRATVLTDTSDKVVLGRQYHDIFNAIFKETEVFDFSGLGWSFDIGVLYNETGCGLTREHIKELDLSFNMGISGCLDHLGELPVLEVFKFAGCVGLTGSIRDLALCPHLKILCLQGCSMLEGTIEALASCVHLVDLDMHNCSRLSGSLEPIRKCDKLEKLNMAGCNGIKGPLPGNVLQLITAKAANFTGCEGPYKIYEDISDIADIKTIDLSMLGPRLYGSLEPLAVLSALENLRLAGCQKLRSTLEPLAEYTTLVDIDIRGCDNLSGSLMPLKASLGLQKLNVSGCNGSAVDQKASLKKQAGKSKNSEKATANWKRAKRKVNTVLTLDASSRKQSKFAGDSSGIKGALPGCVVRLISSRGATFDDCKGPFQLTELLGDIADIKTVDLTMLQNRLEGTVDPLKALTALEALNLRGCAKITGSLEPLSVGCPAMRNLNLYGCYGISGVVSPRTITWLLGVTKRNVLDCGPLKLAVDLGSVVLKELPRTGRFAASAPEDEGREGDDGPFDKSVTPSKASTTAVARVASRQTEKDGSGEESADDEHEVKIEEGVVIDGGRNAVSTSTLTKLCLTIRSASDLLAADKGGTSDPYAVAELVSTKTEKSLVPPRRTRTKTVKKTLAPVWDEGEILWPDVVEPMYSLSLKVTIFDADMLSSELLGGAIIPLTTFDATSTFQSFPLVKMGKMKADATGSVELQCRIDITGGSKRADAPVKKPTVDAPASGCDHSAAVAVEATAAEKGAPEVTQDPSALHRFDLVNMDTLDGWHEALPTLPGFRSSLRLLNLSGTSLRSLEPLKECAGNLEELNLYGCLHIKSDLDALHGFTKLRVLNLDECKRLVGSLLPLEKCIALEHMSLRNCINVVSDLEPLKKLSKLSTVLLSSTFGKMGIYGSLKHLAKCEVLTKLDLRNCDVEEIDEFLYQRGGLPECQVLFTRGDHSESATSSVANRFEDDETLTDDGYDESPRSDF